MMKWIILVKVQLKPYVSTLLAEMFDRKQNILLTKMLNTRHQTWGAKRFNIVELTNVVQQCQIV